jgi:uncharacterized membrane protein
VLIMIEWHVVDAWTTDESRTGNLFAVLAMIGGLAAPLFLFLAGVAVPFAARSHVRKGRSLKEAAWAVQKRGWQVFLIAHAFRLHSYLWNLWGRWDGVFKPDILNILGLGMVAAAWCWGRATTFKQRAIWLLLPAAVILLLAQPSRGWWWPSLLHLRVEAYIRPNGWGQFAIFPWMAFVLVGAAVGEWIAQPRPAEAERRFHGQLALAATATIITGAIAAFTPSPLHTSFWTTSVAYFLLRVGAMTLALAGGWLLFSGRRDERPGPIVFFGQTSMFVYLVHVELAYGLFSAAWKRSLTIPEAAIAYLLFTTLMFFAAKMWVRRTASPWIPDHLRA